MTTILATTIAHAMHQAGIAAQTTAAEQLAAYLLLLERWNQTYNLTAVRQATDMVSRHIVDSLSILPWIKGSRVLDVGSGAGLPGIPLAIACPALQVTLLDSNGKKTRFMRQSVMELGLTNVTVVRCRIEHYQPELPFDSIVSRAFAALVDLVQAAGRLCRSDGRLLVMKGTYPATELAQLPDDYRVEGIHRLEVPGLNADRHLIHLAPNDSPRDNAWLIS